ncbi:hypothetical protein PM082_013813 [Marasmius tenuissimus]|nr:hypothetical protein PM082_013813 [Marasmius tenuissimus]
MITRKTHLRLSEIRRQELKGTQSRWPQINSSDNENDGSIGEDDNDLLVDDSAWARIPKVESEGIERWVDRKIGKVERRRDVLSNKQAEANNPRTGVRQVKEVRKGYLGS